MTGFTPADNALKGDDWHVEKWKELTETEVGKSGWSIQAEGSMTLPGTSEKQRLKISIITDQTQSDETSKRVNEIMDMVVKQIQSGPAVPNNIVVTVNSKDPKDLKISIFH